VALPCGCSWWCPTDGATRLGVFVCTRPPGLYSPLRELGVRGRRFTWHASTHEYTCGTALLGWKMDGGSGPSFTAKEPKYDTCANAGDTAAANSSTITPTPSTRDRLVGRHGARQLLCCGVGGGLRCLWVSSVVVRRMSPMTRSGLWSKVN
jgi:hypothetical protein